MRDIPYDLISYFDRQHLISMGQMSPVVHYYKTELYGPKGSFKQKNTHMEKASFHHPSEDTDTKERNKVVLSNGDGTLRLL